MGKKKTVRCERQSDGGGHRTVGSSAAATDPSLRASLPMEARAVPFLRALRRSGFTLKQAPVGLQLATELADPRRAHAKPTGGLCRRVARRQSQGHPPLEPLEPGQPGPEIQAGGHQFGRTSALVRDQLLPAAARRLARCSGSRLTINSVTALGPSGEHISRAASAAERPPTFDLLDRVAGQRRWKDHRRQTALDQPQEKRHRPARPRRRQIRICDPLYFYNCETHRPRPARWRAASLRMRAGVAARRDLVSFLEMHPVIGNLE